MPRRQRILRTALAAGVILSTTLPLRADDLRTLTADDVIRMGRVSAAALSTDGSMLAYVVCDKTGEPTPVTSASSGTGCNNWRPRVWIADTRGGVPVKLSIESDDAFYAPRWSPDGSRLAVLSERQGLVSLWIWETKTRRGKKLTDSVSPVAQMPPFLEWIDSQRLAILTVRAGSETRLHRSNYVWAMAEATREWQKALNGRETTASVRESGGSYDAEAAPQEEMTVIDTGGRLRTIAAASAFVPVLHVAPGRRHVAFRRQTMMAITRNRAASGVATTQYERAEQVVIADAAGRVLLELPPMRPLSREFSIAWSPAGADVALLAQSDEDDSVQILRGPVTGPLVRVSLTPGLRPTRLLWVDADRLLVFASPAQDRAPGGEAARADWWLASSKHPLMNVTARFATAPDALVPNPSRNLFAGVTDGALWRLNVASLDWTKLTEGGGLQVSRIVWPRDALRSATPSGGPEIDDGVDVVVIAANNGGRREFIPVDLAAGPRPPFGSAVASDPGPRFLAYESATHVAVFERSQYPATVLSVERNEKVRTVVEIDGFLRDITESEVSQIAYRSLDGVDLVAWLILPANYRTGTRYPLVTWVYCGQMFDHERPGETRINYASPLNLQLFSAMGYAVLLPSMPRHESQMGDRRVREPYLDLPNGVLPAVDKVIDMGIADPDKIAVAGHSYGGYSVYGLITQTKRFRAAIAMSGPSNLVNYYGQFEAESRYDDAGMSALDAQLNVRGKSLATGEFDVPPEGDLARYMRNSPIAYVDRVSTPLLIMHGDLDFVPIGSAEEFFSALWRQNKRARFVRYWGEGHTLGSPANLRDWWSQIGKWLDECLKDD